MRNTILFLMMVIALSACNLSRGQPSAQVPTATSGPIGSGKPEVTISSPADGDEIVVGTDLLVSANATDSVGITRVQLIANNQIVKTVSSEAATGDQSMNVLLDYKPSTAGNVKLEVIAYRGAVASDPATIDVTVRANQAQVTATIIPITNIPPIDPNDRTCRALINVGLNVRVGPGTGYNRITTVQPGVQVPITGRTGDNAWWQVRLSNGQSGWVIQRNPNNVNEEFITILGICTGIPIINPPPPPTIVVPTATRTNTPPPTATTVPLPSSTPGPADLLVTSISGETSVTIPLGENSAERTYNVAITNNGSSSTGQFSNTIRIIPGGAVEELGVVGDLGPGQSVSLSIELTFETPGDFTIQVDTDADDAVEEISDFNNRGTLDVTVLAES